MDQYLPPDANRRFMKPSGRVMEKLVHYPWPGNVRELQNVIHRMRVVGKWDEVVAELHSPKSVESDEIEDDDTIKAPFSFLDYIFERSNSYSKDSTSFPMKEIRKNILDQVEKEVISFVLNKTGWNRTKASAMLDVSYRTIINKITELNILPPQHFVDD